MIIASVAYPGVPPIGSQRSAARQSAPIQTLALAATPACRALQREGQASSRTSRRARNQQVGGRGRGSLDALPDELRDNPAVNGRTIRDPTEPPPCGVGLTGGGALSRRPIERQSVGVPEVRSARLRAARCHLVPAGRRDHGARVDLRRRCRPTRCGHADSAARIARLRCRWQTSARSW